MLFGGRLTSLDIFGFACFLDGVPTPFPEFADTAAHTLKVRASPAEVRSAYPQRSGPFGGP